MQHHEHLNETTVLIYSQLDALLNCIWATASGELWDAKLSAQQDVGDETSRAPNSHGERDVAMRCEGLVIISTFHVWRLGCFDLVWTCCLSASLYLWIRIQVWNDMMKYNFWDQHVQRDQQQSSTNSKNTHLAWDSIRSVWWLVTPITETMKQKPLNWEGLKVSFAGLWQWKEVKPVYKDDWCPTIIFQWRKAIAHDSYAMTKHFLHDFNSPATQNILSNSHSMGSWYS